VRPAVCSKTTPQSLGQARTSQRHDWCRQSKIATLAAAVSCLEKTCLTVLNGRSRYPQRSASYLIRRRARRGQWGKLPHSRRCRGRALAHWAWLSWIANFNLSHSPRSKPCRRISCSLGGISKRQRCCLYLAGRRIEPYMAPGTSRRDETAVDDTCLPRDRKAATVP
jgi:hypothetical protein